MCIAIYIASPCALPLVAWREERPAFYVGQTSVDDPVRRHFSWPNVYYAGSHEGCGCGFAYNQLPEDLQEPDDEAAGRASVAALREYVAAATTLGPVQLYACWEGEQSLPVTDRRRGALDDLGWESFNFEQRCMLEFPAANGKAGQQKNRW